MADVPIGLKQLQQIGYKAIFGHPVDCAPLIDMDFEEVLGYLEGNPGIDTKHHHAIRYGIRKVVEYISEFGKANAKRLDELFYNVPKIVRKRKPADATRVTVDEIDSDSSSEDDGTRINPLNQNLQVLAERTLLEMFQSNNATGPSSSDIQPPNTEPSSLNIQPLNGGPSSAFLVHDARPSSLINILPEGPLTPSIIRNDAGSSNLQAFKPTHASILTPIDATNNLSAVNMPPTPEKQHTIDVNQPTDDIIEVAEDGITSIQINLDDDSAEAGIANDRGEIDENPNLFLEDFGETEDLETRLALAKQLFGVPMEVDEPDQQRPQAQIVSKSKSAKRRGPIGTTTLNSRTAQPTRRVTKPYKMIPENWEPEPLKENENTEEWTYVEYDYIPLGFQTFLSAISHKIKTVGNSVAQRNVLAKDTTMPNTDLIVDPQHPPIADLISDPQNTAIEDLIIDPQNTEIEDLIIDPQHPAIADLINDQQHPPIEDLIIDPQHPPIADLVGNLQHLQTPIANLANDPKIIQQFSDRIRVEVYHPPAPIELALSHPENIIEHPDTIMVDPDPIIEHRENTTAGPSHAHVSVNVLRTEPESGDQFRWNNMESKEYLDLLTEIADSNDDLLRRNTTMEVKDAFAACLALHNEKFLKMKNENGPKFTGVSLLEN